MPYLDQTGLSKLWARAKAVFAPKSHTHKASDITGLPAGGGSYLEATIDEGGWSGALYTDGRFEMHRREKMAFGTSVGWLAKLEYPVPATDIAAAHVTASDYRVEKLYCSPAESDMEQVWVAGRAGEACDCEVSISVYGRW